MTTLFYGRPYGKFTEIHSNLRRTVLKAVLAEEIMEEPQFNLTEKQPQHLERRFFLKTDPSIASVLLDWSNETN